MSMKQEMEDLKKKRKIDETGSSTLVSKEELRLLMEPLVKPVLIDLLSKLGSEDPTIAKEIETIAFADSVHRRIFVRDLSLNTTSRSLRNAFKEYGEIENGKVIVSEGTRKSHGFGYIIYKEVKSAQKALRVPGKLIDGRMTHCMLASDEVTRKISDNNRRKLFIGNLSPQVTNGMLYNYFKGHGDIEECSVVYNKDSKESRGYGFVTYKTVEAAEKTLVNLHNKTLKGKHINVQYAYPNKGGSGLSSIPPKTALPVPPKTAEAAKNAIKDLDQSTLEGKNMMVIDADSHKGGVGQSSVPARVPAGYAARCRLMMTVDWRTSRFLTPIRHQKKGKTCVAFVVCGATEFLFNKQHNGRKTIVLSPQDIYDNVIHIRGYNPKGLLFEDAFNWIIENGCVTEDSCPYMGGAYKTPSENREVVFRIIRYTRLPLRMMKGYLEAHGPIAVGIYWIKEMSLFKGSGVYMGPTTADAYKATEQNRVWSHAVLVVGYGSQTIEGQIINFWIIRNSAGEGWGENGYAKFNMAIMDHENKPLINSGYAPQLLSYQSKKCTRYKQYP